MSVHRKNLEAERERRRKAREERQRTGKAGERPPAGAEVETRTPATAAVTVPTGPTGRPQPFTPDLIPEPEEIEATGDLTPDEVDELSRCERAFAHADQAEWMRGKAAHAVRDRRLYRPRTWPEYCEDVLGESESEVNRMIQEWPLAAAVTQIWVTPRPVPASHIRALLPLAEAYGLEATARGYISLRTWAAENSQRVTAAALTSMVRERRQLADGSTPDEPLPVAQFLARKELGPAVPAQATATSREAAEAAGAPADRQDSHPNLGDHPPDSNSAPEPPEVIDAEIVEDDEDHEAAVAVHQAMQEVREGIEEKLDGAALDTLKAIIALGDEITGAARDALDSR